MKRVMVQYKVKADRAEENGQYIRNVFEELQRIAPSGLRYAAFKLDDGLSFVHIASIETSTGENPILGTAAFKTFQAKIQDRCEEPPVVEELEEIGSYRFFG